MGISISSVSSTSIIASVKSSSSDLDVLKKQELDIEKKIQQEKSGKDDEKTKQSKISQLQAQLQQIQTEIQQEQAQGTNNTSSKQAQASKSVDSNLNTPKKNSSDNILDVFA